MHGISLRTVVMSVVVLSALVLTGCGLQVRNVTLLESVEVPTLEALGADADPGWVAYLAGQDYELTEEFCGLAEVQEEVKNIFPAFLAKHITVRSVQVTSLEFVAQEGNFNSINALDTVLTVDDEYYSFSTGPRPEGLGAGVKLNPNPPLNLADAINGDECIKTYMRISGKLPQNVLKFNVVLNYRLRLGFSLF